MSRYKRGTLVFWGCSCPYWVLEWQPENGDGCYWLINAAGESATAGQEEITLHPIW
jgi:hypothetical protein